MRVFQDSIGWPKSRQFAVLTTGLLLLEPFAIDLRGHLVDEMPLAAIMRWALLVAAATSVAGRTRPVGGPVA